MSETLDRSTTGSERLQRMAAAEAVRRLFLLSTHFVHMPSEWSHPLSRTRRRYADGRNGREADIAAAGNLSRSPPQAAARAEYEPHAYSVPACWFFSTAVIIRVAVALKAARNSKLASTPPGPSTGVLASAR